MNFGLPGCTRSGVEINIVIVDTHNILSMIAMNLKTSQFSKKYDNNVEKMQLNTIKNVSPVKS